MRSITMPLLAITCMLWPISHVAAKDASASTSIRLVVPEICNVNAQAFTIAETGEIVGSVQEYCNTSTGYQIAVSHRPLAFSEQALLQYAGQTTRLNNSGFSIVASRSGQRFERVAVKVDARQLSQPLALAFSVVAF